MKRFGIAIGVGLLICAVAGPAGAQTQTVTANITSSLAMDTSPTSSISNWALAATGANTTSGGSISITSNVAYTVSVTADKSRMSEYNTGTSAYVTDGKTLTTAMSVIGASTGGTGVPATAVVGTSTLLATGTGLGTDSYSVTLSQPTLITDAALASGKTYRIVLTYTASSTL